MDTNTLQNNFEEYLNTPTLWGATPVYGLNSFILNSVVPEAFVDTTTANIRLGKRVEHFVFHQLAADPTCRLLAENIQIQDGKRTIGELDALLLSDNIPIHLEIIYKFYLYDPQEGETELAHWIGPNRQDALMYKLRKLREKQLPLLYHPNTQPILDVLSLKITAIKQQVLFKAQLFLPLDIIKSPFKQLNADCVKGFYIKVSELQRFKEAQFYIPQKQDWIMAPDAAVDWLDYSQFNSEVTQWLRDHKSPLCWIKRSSTLEKFFVVWW